MFEKGAKRFQKALPSNSFLKYERLNISLPESKLGLAMLITT